MTEQAATPPASENNTPPTANHSLADEEQGRAPASGTPSPAGRPSVPPAPASFTPPAARSSSKQTSAAKSDATKRGAPAAKLTAKKNGGRNRPPNGTERSLPAVSGVRIKSRPAPRPPTEEATPQAAPPSHLPKSLPPYTDELLAFLFIGVGLLTFLTLISPQSGAIGSAWSGVLRRLFGVGAFVITAVLMGAGALLLAPKVGVSMRPNGVQLAAGEATFVLLLALIHASVRASIGGEVGQVEAYAQAMEGRGGGLVGWAIQDLVYLLFGDVITGIVLIALLIVSVTFTLGLRRSHVLGSLLWLQDWLERMAKGQGSGRPLTSQGLPPNTLPQTQETAAGAEEGPYITLPPIPGRPSIVTGERGAGAVVPRPPGMLVGSRAVLLRQSGGRPLTRIERLKAKHEDRLEEIEYRFRLTEVADRKRTRKRSEKLPPLELLEDIKFERPSDEEINISAKIIEETVADFDMTVRVVGVKAGPTVTQYAVQPFAEITREDGQKVVQRVRVTRISALAKDLALALAAPSVRIQAPVPGTNYIGIEVPNVRPGIVSLRPVMESEQFYKIKSPLAIALGREVDGTPYAADLAKMPHLLIGGTTGSGKSVCLRSIATCLVTNNRPDQLKLILIDPKMVELVRFNGLPHLLGRVEVQLDRIIGVLRWLTREMDRRYRLMEAVLARNIDVYNRGRHPKQRFPHIVVLIDELAELMTQFPDETEHLITRLAQMARATGIHLVVATQRPSTDVVTGLIKANFPARIAFAVASGVDSRVILDSVGAEDLIGRGDMLYQAPEAAAPVRIQGCFVSDREMERIVEFWRSHWPVNDEAEAPWERMLTRQVIIEETDEMLEEAIRLVQQEGEASASLIQRKLNVGYPRAGRIIDALYRLGVVGPEEAGGRTRKVLIKPDEDPMDYIIRQRRGKL